MTLGEKLKYLREVEGIRRNLGRPLTQQEVAQAVKKEVGTDISQSYLSQIESGARPHLTNKTRTLLSKFFKVHPGFLVDDPEGSEMELSDLATGDGKVDHWMLQGAEYFRQDFEVSEALTAVARQKESRRALLLLGRILRTPGLAESMWHALTNEKPRTEMSSLQQTKTQKAEKKRGK